jgi:hypothetical protein
MNNQEKIALLQAMSNNVLLSVNGEYTGLCLLASRLCLELFGDTYKSLIFNHGGLVQILRLQPPAHVGPEANREYWFALNSSGASLRLDAIMQAIETIENEENA